MEWFALGELEQQCEKQQSRTVIEERSGTS